LDWVPNRPKEATAEDDVYTKALKNVNPELLGELGLQDQNSETPEDNEPPLRLCATDATSSSITA
jgi:hypothetical protein